MTKRKLQDQIEQLQQDFLREKVLWSRQAHVLSEMLGILDSQLRRIEQLEAAKAHEPPLGLLLAIQALPQLGQLAVNTKHFIESFELFHQSVCDALQRELRLNNPASIQIVPDPDLGDDDPTAEVSHDQGPDSPSTLPFAAAVAE